jgi:tetratricopeptide (TPR) repeat protein
MADAQRRMQVNQLKPGEDVKIVDNRVQVSGQVAVMNINGLLTKVIFDHNPKNDFYVEESFPLDWMYPHLTPYGIIMKINRQPLAGFTEDILNRDHQFWKQFSKRLTGDIIDYDTPLKDIAAWIEKTYLRRNFEGFTGDRRFAHDDDAQKSFSKLRSSIGGIYAWRLSPVAPAEYRPKSDTEFRRLLKETDFAFRQAFAFCPYSPEAVFRYCQLLLSPQVQRFDDALIVAETCLKLDPYNGQVRGLVETIKSYKQQTAAYGAFQQMEDAVRKNPADFQAAFNLAGVYLQMQQTNQAVQVLDGVLNHPKADAAALRGLIQGYNSFGHRPGLQKSVDKLEAADPKPDGNTLLSLAQAYATLGNATKLESSLERLTKAMPASPEAWYDLAVLKAGLGKPAEALPALRQALELSAKRLQQDPKARDLLANARNEERFGPLRQSPEFRKLVPP